MARRPKAGGTSSRGNGSASLAMNGSDPQMVINQSTPYLNGRHHDNGGGDPIRQFDILDFIRKNFVFVLGALIAGGFLLQPATKSSVDALIKKIDEHAISLEKRDAVFDNRLRAIEESAVERLVWQAHIEDKIDRLGDAAPVSPAPVKKKRR